MKKYVKNAVKELQKSDKDKIEVPLKSKNDYKRCFCRLLYNKFILTIQKKVVPSHLKIFFLRTAGMNVGHDVCVPHDIYFDPYFPELIYLKKGSLIGGESTVKSHQIKGNTLIIGKCVLEERTLMAGLSTILPGGKVSRNSMLSINSFLDTTIPEGELWVGKPAKLLKKLTDEEIDKFFKPSDGNYKEYYKAFKKNVKEFLKDPDKMFFKMQYNGKRLNAGDDWWRARNVLRIFYNGILVEITRRLHHSFFKTFLLRMVGVKIGKKCRIGKGVVFDHLYGDNVTLEDNIRVDDHCYFDGHSYTISQTIFGKTLVKKGTHLKHDTFLAAGTLVGENVVTEPYTMLQKEIPANEVWGGIPGKFIKKND
ncbi:hypothetical protein CEE44_04755 [Candidatus Woesearchaeota archaeon B3_Woes]|nr:MAG: hypothetical protein CEE44_04755 [Candidatus Woesearchaeota archaeon B3_Woes]